MVFCILNYINCHASPLNGHIYITKDSILDGGVLQSTAGMCSTLLFIKKYSGHVQYCTVHKVVQNHVQLACVVLYSAYSSTSSSTAGTCSTVLNINQYGTKYSQHVQYCTLLSGHSTAPSTAGTCSTVLYINMYSIKYNWHVQYCSLHFTV